MFFAPWCGHCKRLAPTWNELAQLYNKNLEETDVVIAKVDCTQQTSLCSKHGVSGYPTLKFFNPLEDEPIRFKGTRDIESFEKFINEQMSESDEPEEPKAPEPKKTLVELDETYEDKIQKGHWFIKFYAPWCGHCKRLAPTWEELAKTFEFNENINIAKVDCTQHKTVCDKHSVKGYPSLIWFSDGKQSEKYSGSRSHEDLKKYVSDMTSKTNGEAKNTAEKVPEYEEEVGIVLSLGEKTFEDLVGQGVTFVKFYAPWCGHCKKLAPTWDELAKKLAKNTAVHIAKVDCTEESGLCSTYEVSGYPTLLLFRNGVQLKEYSGKRDLASLHAFVEENLGHDEL
ncbi:thioredoxin domain-containing protein 5-like [Liolophura sinensis]|uniref:thioredoxin domain-containing protein 5-like n=1 Tax=Liolophura sinensis TaxID=3198878 RepID=UPI00315867E5